MGRLTRSQFWAWLNRCRGSTDRMDRFAIHSFSHIPLPCIHAGSAKERGQRNEHRSASGNKSWPTRNAITAWCCLSWKQRPLVFGDVAKAAKRVSRWHSGEKCGCPVCAGLGRRPSQQSATSSNRTSTLHPGEPGDRVESLVASGEFPCGCSPLATNNSTLFDSTFHLPRISLGKSRVAERDSDRDDRSER